MKTRSENVSLRSSYQAYNPKWSWADPMDDQACPGSYNTKSTFESIKGYSMPKAVKKIAKLGDNTFSSPGVGTYSPLANLTKRRNTCCRIGTGPARKLEFIDSYRSRSPGPIYKLPGVTSTISSSFSRDKRGFSKTQNQGRSAIDIYTTSSPTRSRSRSPIRKGGKHANSTFSVKPGCTMKGARASPRQFIKAQLSKGMEGPGPGTYMTRQCNTAGQSFTRVKRVGSPSQRNPGPGQYESRKRDKIYNGDFGKRSRKFDIRHLTRHHDFFRY